PFGGVALLGGPALPVDVEEGGAQLPQSVRERRPGGRRAEVALVGGGEVVDEREELSRFVDRAAVAVDQPLLGVLVVGLVLGGGGSAGDEVGELGPPVVDAADDAGLAGEPLPPADGDAAAVALVVA